MADDKIREKSFTVIEGLNKLSIFKKMKVKNKIISSFVILIICLLSISGFNAYMTRKLNQKTSQMFDVDLKISQIASDASKQLYKAKISSQKVLYSDNYQEALEQYNSDNDVLLARVKKFSSYLRADALQSTQVKEIAASAVNYRIENGKMLEVFNEAVLLRKEIKKEIKNLSTQFPILINSIRLGANADRLISDIYNVQKTVGEFAESDDYQVKMRVYDYDRTVKSMGLSKKARNNLSYMYHIANNIIKKQNIYNGLQQKVENHRSQSQEWYDKMAGSLFKIEKDYQQYVTDEIKEVEDTQERFSLLEMIITFVSIIIGIIMAMMIFASIVGPLQILSLNVRKIASGSIPRININTFNKDDEFGLLAVDFKQMCVNIRTIIEDIKKYSTKINESVKHSITNSEQISEGTANQSAFLEETTGMVIELADSIQNVAELLTASLDLSRETMKSAHTGGQAVKDTIKEIYEIRAISQDAETSLNSLREGSKKINSITEIISTIADQTNMLALNAAIEAARAGEQGRGFAVVSDQVAKLAERSARSAREIEEIIVDISDDIKSVMNVMDNSIRKVSDGVKQAEISGETLKVIIGNIEKVNKNIEHVTSISSDEVDVSNRMNDAIQNVASSSEEMAASSESSFLHLKTLGDIADNLEHIVAQFQVEETKS